MEVAKPFPRLTLVEAAEDWDGPQKGKRGGTFWVHKKTGRKVYKDPTQTKEKKPRAKAEPKAKAKKEKVDYKAKSQEAKSAIEAFRKDDSPENRQAAVDALGSLRLSDMNALKKELGIKASGNKSQLAQ